MRTATMARRYFADEDEWAWFLREVVGIADPEAMASEHDKVTFRVATEKIEWSQDTAEMG